MFIKVFCSVFTKEMVIVKTRLTIENNFKWLFYSRHGIILRHVIIGGKYVKDNPGKKLLQIIGENCFPTCHTKPNFGRGCYDRHGNAGQAG